jgi:hypothetical protein
MNTPVISNRKPANLTTKMSHIMSSSKKSSLIATFTSLLCIAVVALPDRVAAYDAAADFSSSNNPNGVWSYGWAYYSSAFNLDTISTNMYNGLGLSGWLAGLDASGNPYSLFNGTANPILLANTTYQPGQLSEHPGASNEVAIVRWTAPSAGIFSISATFSGLSAFGDSVDVHILHNGISFFNSTVTGSPSPTSYSSAQSILAGDTIDFVVGNGGNGANEDTTGLSATIVPEPSTGALVGMALGCLLSLGFQNRKWWPQWKTGS